MAVFRVEKTKDFTIDHERNIHVTFRFKNEFQGKAVELCATM